MGAAPPNFPYPLQVPGYDLPGAEYLSLAPNRTIALQGRRRRLLQSPLTSAPASSLTTVNTTVVLESPFTPTSGVFVHFFHFDFIPAAPGLSLSNAQAGLSMQTIPFTGDYPLGNPVISTLVFNISSTVLTDRDRFVCEKDILAANFPPGATGNQLSLATAMTINNTTAGAIQFATSATIIYTRLDGITE